MTSTGKGGCSETVFALGPQQAAERLENIGSPIAMALRSFLLTVSRRKAQLLRIFEVRYGYGQLIVGPRSSGDEFGKILTPCLHPAHCKYCQQLLEILHHHRPLAFVLDGSCEEYTEYEQSSPPELRRAPLRFYSKGDVIGVAKFLNQVYLPGKPVRSIFGGAARRMTAGARSIFLTTSVSSSHSVQSIPKEILGIHGFRDTPIKQIGKVLDDDHWLFFRLLADTAVRQKLRPPWQARLLFVPVESLAALLKDAKDGVEAKDLLLAMLSESFLQSRNTRSDRSRQMVVFDRLSDRQISDYASRTIHHLVELIRGEFPGFVPHDPKMADDFGPFTPAYEYFRCVADKSPKTMDGFPMLLRPIHLDQTHRQPVYYSLEKPSLLAPVGTIQSFRSFAEEVSLGLSHLAKNRPGLFDFAKCEFFISKGKPQGPGKKSSELLPYQAAPQIEEDFRAQIDNAKARQWLSDNERVFAENKWGFMAAFVRVSAGV